MVMGGGIWQNSGGELKLYLKGKRNTQVQVGKWAKMGVHGIYT